MRRSQACVDEVVRGTQRYGEGEVVPKDAPIGLVDLEDGDPGVEYSHPEEKVHS